MAGLGLKGHIGFAKESVGGTPVAATNYIKATSENLTVAKDYFEPINISGRIMTPDDAEGVNRVQGDIVFPFHPVDGGFFLMGGITEAQTVTEVETGALWEHRFRPPSATSWDASFAMQPMTFEIARDVGSSQQYAGCNISQLQFSMQPNQELRCTASMIGRTATHIAETSPSFTASPAEFLGFDTASLQINGAARAEFESFNLTINNNLEGIATLSNKRDIHKIRRSDYMDMRISASLEFLDISDYLDFINENEKAFIVSMTRADSFQLVFEMPRVLYRSFPLGTGGRERNIVELEGRCFYHVGSATNLEVKLTTTASYF